LFCRAEEREATTLLDALKNYEEASGQAINMQKSEIFFSKNTSEAIKEKMQNIFQVTESKDQANILVYHLW
jgi:selenocysteine lyase/cysteine desulfurase